MHTSAEQLWWNRKSRIPRKPIQFFVELGVSIWLSPEEIGEIVSLKSDPEKLSVPLTIAQEIWETYK